MTQTAAPTPAQAAESAAQALTRALSRACDHDWDVRAQGALVEARHRGGALLRLAALADDDEGSGGASSVTLWQTILAAAGAILARSPTTGLLHTSTARGRGRLLKVTLFRPGSGALVGTQETLAPSAPLATTARVRGAA